MSCNTPKLSENLSDDPCVRYRQIEQALYARGSGEQRVEVRYGNQWVRYGLGSVAFLERERARLMALCQSAQSAASGSGSGGRRAIIVGRSGC